METPLMHFYHLISYARCFGLSKVILVQFTAEICITAYNRKKH